MLNHSSCNILFIDSVPKDFINYLQQQGYTVTYDPGLSEDRLTSEITKYNILVLSNKTIDKKILDNAKSLSLVIKMGPGRGNIDLDYASSKGIFVCNTPHSHDDSIAELIVGHLIACDRHIVQNIEHLRHGEWRQKFFLQCDGLTGRTIGIIGSFCRDRLVEIVQSFKMNILFAETYEECLSIAPRCDAISVNVEPFTSEFILNDNFFKKMKNGSIFINVTNSSIVDYEALKNLIDEKDLQVGLDVYPVESKATVADFIDTELAELISSGTSHIGHSTKQSIGKTTDEILNIINDFVLYGKVKNCLNLHKNETDVAYIVRHKGILTKILVKLESLGILVKEVNNSLIDSGECHCAIIRFEGRENIIEEIRSIDGVIGVGLI